MLDSLFEVEPRPLGHIWSAEGNRRRWRALRGQDIRHTPRAVFDELDAEFHFTVDVAALPDNALCPRYFTPDDDGLKQAWDGERCWMNPPYSAIDLWAAKATRSNAKVVVGLLPVRTDLAWFHEDVMATGAEVRFIRGRLRFGDPEGRLESNAPFPSMIVVWDSHKNVPSEAK